MKKLTSTKKLALAIIASTALTLPAVPAFAKDLRIGVAMSAFDDNFRTLLRTSMEKYGKEKGVELQVEDAKNELGTQLNQVQNFIASGVDAIIVNAVDTDSTQTMSDDAEAAGIPLVYVNLEPINLNSLPDDEAYVGSKESDAGTYQAQEVCRQLHGKGNVVIMMGDLSHDATIKRTKAVHDVFKTKECLGVKIVSEQTAKWMRSEANNLMTNWLSAGIDFDAVIANNDEMALGAIQALKASGRKMDSVIIAGIDATADGLAAMKAGDLDITVFQDASSQGRGAVDAAIQLAEGKPVDQEVWIPFQLVTPANYQQFTGKN